MNSTKQDINIKNGFGSLIESKKTPLIACFFCIVYMFTLLVISYKRDYYSESPTHILQVTSKEARLATKVNIGLHITNFPEFSFYQNKFKMNAIIWFKFPLGTESLNTIEQFSFQNGIILRHPSRLPISPLSCAHRVQVDHPGHVRCR